MQNRVYDTDGIIPALSQLSDRMNIQVKSATKEGFETAKNGDSINLSNPNSKTRRGRVGVAQTLDTQANQSVLLQGKIRRLTEVECERLQGFPQFFIYNISEMTNDELCVAIIHQKLVEINFETGQVFRIRGGYGLPIKPKLVATKMNGYLAGKLSVNGCKKLIRLHRLIWIAANGVIPDGFVIDHINSIKTDNRLCNLQLLTATQNSIKTYEDGLYNPPCKIHFEIAEKIRADYSEGEDTVRGLAEKYKISKYRISQIIRYEGWTEYGIYEKQVWINKKEKTFKIIEGVQEISRTQRYKMCGNAVTTLIVKLIGEKLLKNL